MLDFDSDGIILQNDAMEMDNEKCGLDHSKSRFHFTSSTFIPNLRQIKRHVLCMLFLAISFIQQQRVRKFIWYLTRWLS